MKDDADTLTPEPPTQTLSGSLSEPEPTFIARARRILTGDIRPDDYLEVTPEIRRRVNLSMDHAIARLNGQMPAPEVELRQVRQETLSFHHSGENIAYIEDEHGIIVLAVGLEQVRNFTDTLLSQSSRTIAIDYPYPWDDAGAYANGIPGSVHLEVQ